MLERSLEPVLLKRSGVALALWGEPGIGKSYTAEQLLREAPCHGVSVHAVTPLPALVKLVPKPSTLQGWARATLSRLEDGAPVEAPRALEAITAALARAAPFLLHVEDLHEANDERLELLVGLARMARRTRGVGLLVTSRTDPGEPFERHRLVPLSHQETSLLLRQVLGSELPDGATAWIAERAGGNPLFALEYLRYFGRQGHLWNDGSRWHWRRPELEETPPSIDALLEYHLGDVLADEALAAALGAAALLPVGADAALLARAAGLTDEGFAAALRELDRRGITQQRGFVHPLYREVTLRLIPEERRRRTARRALEVVGDDARLAAALIDDAALEPTEAVHLLQRAAESARATGDELQAARLLARASDAASGEEAGRMALEAATLFQGRDFPRMLALAAKAVPLLPDPTEALFLQAAGLAIRGDDASMREVLERLPEAAKRGAAWLQRYLLLLHQAGRRDELIAVWEASPDKDACDALTVHYVGWAYLHAGNSKAAEALVREWSGRHGGDQVSADALTELQASISFYVGDYDAADRIYSDLLARATASGGAPKHQVANLLRNRAVTRMQQSRQVACLPDLQEALRLFEEVGHGLHHAGTLVMMSYVHQELGEYERGEEVLSEALEVAQRSGQQLFLSQVLAQLSDLYLEWPSWSHPSLALRYATQAAAATLPEPDGIQAITATYVLSRAKTAAGRPTEGRELADKALAAATTMQAVEAVVAAEFAGACALEALGRVDEARHAFAGAERRARSHGLELHAHRYGLEVDRIVGDAASAAQRRAWFADRGLLHGVNIAERYFPDLASRPTELRAETAVRLELLGPMRWSRNGLSTPVRGRKRQALLATLLEARLTGRIEVGRLELIERLYPGSDEPKAAASLKQLVSDLRKEFGAGVILTTVGGYALGDVTSDVEEFFETGDTRLWRGGFAEGIDLDVRESVLARLHAALFDAASNVLDHDAVETARLTEILRSQDPYNHDYLRLHLEALRASRHQRALISEYSRARSELADVGEVLPESWEAYLQERRP